MDKTVSEINGEAQRTSVISTLSQAFQDDPSLIWMLPNAASRQRALPGMFDWLYDDHREHGLILASPGSEVVTFWRRPGKVHHDDPLWPKLIWRLMGVFRFALGRAAKVGDVIHKHVPAGEDWLYLRYAGVRPDSQGKGWGGHAIRAGIAHANIHIDTFGQTECSVGVAEAIG